MDPLRLVAGNSRGLYLLMLIGALAFVVAGVFIVRQEPGANALVGWSSILFFGGCALVFVRQLLDSRPRIVLDQRGVFDRTLGIGVIPWRDIVGAELKSMQRNHFICLELRNPEHWIGKLSPTQRKLVALNQRMGYSALNVNLSGVAADPHQVLEFIVKMAALHARD
ncbi:STM3941 family protein [Lysobacter capsici]|uniref:STM3941 family protein n=1 Tax=Lysobacter capsici TaxID=435897 RepID=UPI000A79D427|nr:STM3941 family protein [Lysobacter capsici]